MKKIHTEHGFALWIVIVITFIVSFVLISSSEALIQHSHILKMREGQLQAQNLVDNGVAHLLQETLIIRRIADEFWEEARQREKERQGRSHEDNEEELHDESDHEKNDDELDNGEFDELQRELHSILRQAYSNKAFTLKYPRGTVEIKITYIDLSCFEGHLNGITNENYKQSYKIKINWTTTKVIEFKKVTTTN